MSTPRLHVVLGALLLAAAIANVVVNVATPYLGAVATVALMVNSAAIIAACVLLGRHAHREIKKIDAARREQRYALGAVEARDMLDDDPPSDGVAS